MRNPIQAKFYWQLLHPKYFPTWLGIILLYLLIQLPYPIIYRLGKQVGRLFRHLSKRRFNIAKRNLELCFPDWSAERVQSTVLQNFESTGLALFEIGIAWFWSDKRIKKWCHMEGIEHVTNALNREQGVLLVGIHFLTLELGARVIGIYAPGVGVYRPHNNKLMEWLQTWGRLRSNKFMLDRKDLKGMIRALKQGELLWYAPDHDYGAKSSVFVPFFAVEEAATTVGTYLLIKQSFPAIVPFIPKRRTDGSGYDIIAEAPVNDISISDATTTAFDMNRLIERCINQAPEQYMWLHRRFKTRPKGKPSVY